jgi:hypothetical protein
MALSMNDGFPRALRRYLSSASSSSSILLTHLPDLAGATERLRIALTSPSTHCLVLHMHDPPESLQILLNLVWR